MIKTIKNFYQYIQYDTHFGAQDVLALLAHIDDAMVQASQVLKDDETSTVVVVEVQQQKWVVKRSNTKNVWHMVRRALMPSRAWKNWQNAKKLEALGIASLKPIALLEARWGIFKRYSYFVCEYIPAKDALHFFRQSQYPDTICCEVVDNICQMLKKLAQAGLSHRDLNLSNILIKDRQPILIDLDAMRGYRHPWLMKWAARKEYNRFMENWLEMPGLDRHTEAYFKEKLYS